MTGEEEHHELNEAALRASYIVTEQIESLLQRAEQDAELIRRSAERDAEDIRRNAVASAQRLLGRLSALEFPLGQLVVNLRDEVDQVAGELEAGAPVDAHGTELPPASEGPAPARTAGAQRDAAQAQEPADQRTDEPALKRTEESVVERTDEPVDEHTEEPVSERTAEHVEERTPEAEGHHEGAVSFHDDAPAPTRARKRPRVRDRNGLQDVDTPPPDGEQKPGGRRGRRRPKQPKAFFITAEGHCAICQRSFRAGSEDALKRSGWKVSGDVGLCPDCQADRWQLPEGARLPFRRGSA